MESLHLCPIPYFVLDRKLTLVDASNTGYDLLKQGENLLTIIEDESSPKFARMIHRDLTGKIELNLRKNDSFELYDITYQFSEYTAVLPCSGHLKRLSIPEGVCANEWIV